MHISNSFISPVFSSISLAVKEVSKRPEVKINQGVFYLLLLLTLHVEKEKTEQLKEHAIDVCLT